MSPSSKSPVTGHDTPAWYIHASEQGNGHFQDASGRTLLLRGVNLASSAKTPIGQPGAKLEGFWESAKSGKLSFVNRVLDLDGGDADVHFTRLREWGFNTLRYVFTWESIEHEGPGKYDHDYIQYTLRMLQKCKDHGFRVYMDPHQDLFSRFAGGSGAPYWTILACGMQPEHFTESGAAVIQCEYPDPLNPAPETFPDMIWASNYTRLACQTLFTLFFAGRDFAPLCIIDGINIQDWLQQHYFNAIRKLGKAIAEQQNGSLLDSCVIGWDSLNEPNAGLLGIDDLAQHAKDEQLKVGFMPTPFEAMRLGMGEQLSIENWRFSSTGPKRAGNVTVNSRRKKAWLAPEDEETDPEGRCKQWGWRRSSSWKLGVCIWALHGVWDVESKELLKPAYFYSSSSAKLGEEVDFGRDYWLPHWQAYAKIVRDCHPEAILFIHPPVFKIPPNIIDTSRDLIKDRAVFSTHFYDGVTLVTKHWNFFNFDALGFLRGKYSYKWQAVKVGEKAIRQCLQDQLGVLRQDGRNSLGSYPVMMSEIGIPFDLDKKKAYETGDYSNQVRALDASLNACDGPNALNNSVWTYCPDNTHAEGDLWNGEDLSIWSQADCKRSVMRMRSSSMSKDADKPTESQIEYTDLNDGARALPAFCRPFPTACVGMPTNISFNISTSAFRLDLLVRPNEVSDTTLPTEIYLPFIHYAASSQDDQTSAIPSESDRRELAIDVKVSSGRWEVKGQKLFWYHGQPRDGPLKKEWIAISSKGGPNPLWALQYGQTADGSLFDRLISCCSVS